MRTLTFKHCLGSILTPDFDHVTLPSGFQWGRGG